MKKRVKKLQLNKVTIQDLAGRLDHNAQEEVKGGNGNNQSGTTCIPVYCTP
ncbi:MAG: hypothetical protein GY940_23010 [bacterium]|nr:hypothetical protein [bacterium]